MYSQEDYRGLEAALVGALRLVTHVVAGTRASTAITAARGAVAATTATFEPIGFSIF